MLFCTAIADSTRMSLSAISASSFHEFASVPETHVFQQQTASLIGPHFTKTAVASSTSSWIAPCRLLAHTPPALTGMLFATLSHLLTLHSPTVTSIHFTHSTHSTLSDPYCLSHPLDETAATIFILQKVKIKFMEIKIMVAVGTGLPARRPVEVPPSSWIEDMRTPAADLILMEFHRQKYSTEGEADGQENTSPNSAFHTDPAPQPDSPISGLLLVLCVCTSVQGHCPFVHKNALLHAVTVSDHKHCPHAARVIHCGCFSMIPGCVCLHAQHTSKALLPLSWTSSPSFAATPLMDCSDACVNCCSSVCQRYS